MAQRPDVIAGHACRRNIERNRAALQQRLLRQFTMAERKAVAAFALEHTRVLVVTANDFDYAYQIFLTINDRGKRLTVEDIFRGEILGPLDTAQRQRFSSIIEEMDRYMDAEEKRRSRGKTFFSHLAIAYSWSGAGIVAGLRRVVEQRGGPMRFAAEVFAPMAEAYLAVKSAGASLPPGSLSADACHWLTALSWLERYGDDDWVGAAMLGVARLDRSGPELARFLAALDRFAHGLIVLGCGRGARRNLYAPVLEALTAEELPADPAALLKLSAKDEAFIVKSMAMRLHHRDPQLARLVLIRLDAMLSGRPLAHYQPLTDPAIPRPQRLTVEHVLPQGGVQGTGWSKLFPRRLRRAAIAQCIGNLVLVSEAANQAADQLEFPQKKLAYFGAGSPRPHPLMLTEALRDMENWDATAVAQRYEMLTSALYRLWRFEGPVPPFPVQVPVDDAPTPEISAR